MRQMEAKTWCVEWFGSEGDFLAGGKRQPISLAPPFRSRNPVRDWRLGTATRRSVHFRQRALCLGGLEPDRNYRQQPCLPSRISGLHDRRTLAQSLDLEVRQQRGRIGSGAIATSRDRGNQCRSRCSGGRSLLL
jgi:hypothetical protein